MFSIEPSRPGVFYALSPPQSSDLDHICTRVAERFERWLRRRGLLLDEVDHGSNERPPTLPLDACTQSALGIGQLCRIEDDGTKIEPEPELELRGPKPGRRSRFVGQARGYHLHAGVGVPAHNRLGRELLLRYCARPPLSLERLSILPDGRIAYRIKNPWRPDQTHRVMTPLQFLARLVALIPPPRSPLIRFHGAFAPHFAGRALVVADGASKDDDSATSTQHDCEHSPGAAEPRPRSTTEEFRQRDSAKTAKPVESKPTAAPVSPEQRRLASAATTDNSGSGKPHTWHSAQQTQTTSPNAREFRSAPWRIDWATLLQRVYDIDVLACPCGGRLIPVELVTDRNDARAMLRALDLPDAPPPAAGPTMTLDLDELPPPDW